MSEENVVRTDSNSQRAQNPNKDFSLHPAFLKPKEPARPPRHIKMRDARRRQSSQQQTEASDSGSNQSQ